MRQIVPPLILLAAVTAALPARAETRYLAYDAADRVTQALTRGVTLEVDRGFFGGIAVRSLISTTARGSADMRAGGPDVRGVLPAGVQASDVYSIVPEGDGRGLTRALCPGADEAWLALGAVRLGRPLEVEAVGRWADGTLRHCVSLKYDWRGEWAVPPAAGRDAPEPLASAR